MKTFNYRNRKLFSGTHLIGFLALATGIFGLSTPWIYGDQVSESKALLVGGIASALGIFIASMYTGTLIDFNEKKIKFYTSLLHMKMGEWQSLPGISTVVAREIQYSGSRKPNGISPTFSWRITAYQITLYDEKGNSVTNFDYTSKAKGKRIGIALSEGLDAKFEAVAD